MNRAEPEKAGAGAMKSQTGEAYRLLREAIVAGRLVPGMRLSPAELSTRFGLGPTPIREALARLAAENLAIAFEQRGFRVAPLSARELRELLDLRLGFEREAMLRSMREGGDNWEAGVVSTCHLLLRCVPPHPGSSPSDMAEWSRRHDAFHTAIIAGCEAPWLKRFHRMAVEQIERYRVAILGAHRVGGEPSRLTALLSHEEHARLRDAVLARDEAAAATLLTAHIGESAAIFAALFEGVETGERAAKAGNPD